MTELYESYVAFTTDRYFLANLLLVALIAWAALSGINYIERNWWHIGRGRFMDAAERKRYVRALAGYEFTCVMEELERAGEITRQEKQDIYKELGHKLRICSLLPGKKFTWKYFHHVKNSIKRRLARSWKTSPEETKKRIEQKVTQMKGTRGALEAIVRKNSASTK